MAVPPPTPRLAFREMTADDLDDLSALLGDPEVLWVYPHPYSRDEALGWIEWNVRLYRERGFGLWYLTLVDTGEFVGNAGSPHRRSRASRRSRSATTSARCSGAAASPPRRRGHAATTPGTWPARSTGGLHRPPQPRVAARGGQVGLDFEREAKVPGKVLRVYAAAL